MFQESNFKSICHRTATNQTHFVWIGLECSTWSRARHAGTRNANNKGAWPGPLLSDSVIRGLSNFSAKGEAKVLRGNALCQLAAKLCCLCVRRNVSIVMANSKNFRLWQSPFFSKLLKINPLVILDHCQLGNLFRKPAALLTYGLPVSAFDRQCEPEKSICGASACKHVSLQGEGSKELQLFATAAASAYPRSFCSHVANILL